MSPLPGQWRRYKLRKSRCIGHCPGGASQQHLYSSIQQIPPIAAGGDEKPNGGILRSSRHRDRGRTSGIDPCTASSQRPGRSRDGSRNCQVRMREPHNRTGMRAVQRNFQCSLIQYFNRVSNTSNFRPQLAGVPSARAASGPARYNIRCGDRRIVRKAGIRAQCHDPYTQTRVTRHLPPFGSQTRDGVSFAVYPDQRFVKLPEQQSLTLVRWTWCVGGIHPLGQPHRCDTLRGTSLTGRQPAIRR